MRAAEQGGSTIRRVSTAGNRQIRLDLLASIEEKLKKPPFDGFRWDLGSVPAGRWSAPAVSTSQTI